jgi:DNA mismatch endonuclease, patch repair protein
MQANRSRDTAPELAVRREVHRRGLRYRVASRPLPGLRRTADLVFSRARVAVFIDGCFWHGCPTHHRLPATNRSYWEPKVERNKARDLETTAVLERAGWTVLRFWEHEDAEAVADAVERAVRSARPDARGRLAAAATVDDPAAAPDARASDCATPDGVAQRRPGDERAP